MDAIKKPAHYNQGPIECIDAMKIVLTPEEFRGYLKGNVFKYLWREKDKNGIEDLHKGREYYDRLIEHCDESLLDASKGLVKAWTCENGKAKQVYPDPKWTPRVGDWVRIKKPDDIRSSACIWVESMNKYDGQVIHVEEIEEGAVVHEDYGFLFSWLEPTEPPKEQPQPPDGWRWLEVGEILLKGDTTNTIYEIPEDWIGIKCAVKHNLLRRNKFEVGEKVVEFINNRIGVVKDIEAIGKGIASGKAFLYHVEMQDTKGMILFSPHQLAPYIEEQS